VRARQLTPASSSASYLPGLDGLRAISVVAVLLYHAGVRSMPGGFLGVEVFFVISGYLITLLLTREYTGSSTISLRSFWGRRARRLLPALYALLGATSIVFVVLYREDAEDLRKQVWAALGYVTNWYLIVSDQSYFAIIERPSPLQHLWSLAIEEQFYLVWPLLLLAMLRLFGGRRRPVAALATVGAIASTIWMAVLFQPAVDPSRVYYGTDTRAAGLLLGAALALVWRPSPSWRETGRHDDVSLVALDLSGMAAVVGLVLCFARIHEYDTFLYRGGFALVSILSAVVIAAAVHPRTVIGRYVLSPRMVTWIGVRSYALYLWHWPIFVLTRPQIDLPWTFYPTLLLRFVLTFVAADLSYRYIEVPLRNGAFTRWRRRLGRRHGGRRWAGPVALASISGLVLVAVNYVGASPASEAGLETPASSGTTTTTAAPAHPFRRGGPAAARAAPATTTSTIDPAELVTVIGDSVLLGAKAGIEEALQGSGWIVDYYARPALMIHQANDELPAPQLPIGDTVIVGLGHNSLWERDRVNYDAWAERFDDEVDELVATLERLGADRIIWITLREPSQSVIPPAGMAQYQAYVWYFPYVNERLRALSARNPEVILADWAAVSNQSGLTYDAFHLTARGIDLMIAVIRDAGDL
jgi:peptidoglycan/LPS O-acetylase OafA/YrhL